MWQLTLICQMKYNLFYVFYEVYEMHKSILIRIAIQVN